jgi:Tol biopolymer transport system component
MLRSRGLRPLLGLVCVGVLAGPIAGPAHATFPGDNGRIAYTWSVGGESYDEPPRPRLVGVVSVRRDGTARRLVARRGTEPRYSPDGRRIAFLRSQRLWVARADGSSARPVTPSDWLVGNHEWSPRGTRLAFVRAFANSVRSALYTVALDGSGLRRLLKAPQPLDLRSGAWSPNGKAIVYQQSSGQYLVRVFRAGRVTTLVRPASRPTWSRRGLIAYETPVGGENRTQVCVRRAKPGAQLRCFGFVEASTSNPTWSPDGHRLMLMYSPRFGPDEIWTMRPDGTVLARAPRAPRENIFPIFSPDGGRLAFSEIRFKGGLAFRDLWVMRPNGSETRRVVRGGQATAADWQPRSRG